MTNKKCCVVCKILGLLVVIGAINWGLVGAFHYNLVESLLGGHLKVIRIVYVLVGIAGLGKLISCIKPCPCCKTDGADCKK